ncbi:MAG TPA: elongation factor P [Patescibacteria group bacterium]|nr:elongation factor P [Patescibacteria group bacterium]
MSDLTDIKKGLLIKYNGDPYVVMEAKFLRMQQRKPVMQTKLKNIKTGKVVEYSFKQGESAEEADVTRRKANYLYEEKGRYAFMEQENYEQYEIDKEMVGEAAKFMKEAQEVDLIFYEDNIIGVELPPKVVLKVISAPPGIKGDTVSGSGKPVTLETGAVINAPLFVNEGDNLRVNTQTGEYVERA